MRVAVVVVVVVVRFFGGELQGWWSDFFELRPKSHCHQTLNILSVSGYCSIHIINKEIIL